MTWSSPLVVDYLLNWEDPRAAALGARLPRLYPHEAQVSSLLQRAGVQLSGLDEDSGVRWRAALEACAEAGRFEVLVELILDDAAITAHHAQIVAWTGIPADSIEDPHTEEMEDLPREPRRLRPGFLVAAALGAGFAALATLAIEQRDRPDFEATVSLVSSGQADARCPKGQELDRYSLVVTRRGASSITQFLVLSRLGDSIVDLRPANPGDGGRVRVNQEGDDPEEGFELSYVVGGERHPAAVYAKVEVPEVKGSTSLELEHCRGERVDEPFALVGLPDTPDIQLKSKD